MSVWVFQVLQTIAGHRSRHMEYPAPVPWLSFLHIGANRTQGIFFKTVGQSLSVAQSGLELTILPSQALNSLQSCLLRLRSAGLLSTSHQARQTCFFVVYFVVFCFWYWELNIGPHMSRVNTLPPSWIPGLIAVCS